jgi:Na+-transporting NADH:ubiquinone oxidoreductase subunit C
VHSNFYTFVYAAGISVITAIVLAFTSETLKPKQEYNVALDNKKNILRSVRLDLADQNKIEQTYSDHIVSMVINDQGEVIEGVDVSDVIMKKEVAKPYGERRLPLYVFTADGGKKCYIVPMWGVGLWGPIWGYLSIEDDFNTVYGSNFDHKGETPGLGAEIAEKYFQEQFQGKKILDDSGAFVSVRVLKPSEKFDGGEAHRVDGISGGTITSRGTDAMLMDCVKPYLTYFEKQKSAE